MPLQLREVLKEMKPKRVFPIHGEHVELFKKFMKRLRVQIVERGKEYSI